MPNKPQSRQYDNVPARVTVTEDGYVQVVISGVTVQQRIGAGPAAWLDERLAREAERCQ